MLVVRTWFRLGHRFQPRRPSCRYIHVTTCKPRVELALRYSIRVRFRNLSDSRAFSARIDELLSVLSPSEDEYAAILRHAREIGAAMEHHLSGPRDHPAQRWRNR
jgi:hypothetical protein